MIILTETPSPLLSCSAGLMMVSVGSLLLALEPSNGTCVGSIWMINVGYTTQLVPTLIRVSTINKIVRESLRMRVVEVDRKKLLLQSIVMSAIAMVYCTLWTILDPPQAQISLQVTQDVNEVGETIVKESSYCDSESPIWYVFVFMFTSLPLFTITPDCSCSKVSCDVSFSGLPPRMRQCVGISNEISPECC